MQSSPRFALNTEDFKRMLLNFVVFAAPDFIIFLGALTAKFSAEGALGAVLVLNLLIDGLRKFLDGQPKQ